jgi:PleD family two-component response regulator
MPKIQMTSETELPEPVKAGETPLRTTRRWTPRDRPLVLIGESHEWMARSLASVIAPRGYDVIHAFTPDEIVQESRLRLPDVIVLGARLPGRDCVEICRDLRRVPESGAVTPILVLTSLQISQAERLELFWAGAWDCIRFPEQVPELLLKIQTFAMAKSRAEQGLREGFLDVETGLYNLQGLLRRARDESAEAWRYSTPLACVAMAPDEATEERLREDPDREFNLVQRVSELLRTEMRGSDVIARLDRLQFAVLAPSTDGVGATIFARRLIDAFDLIFEREPLFRDHPVVFQAGSFGVEDIRKEGLDAEKLLRRASAALKRARDEGPGRRIEPYQNGRIAS